MVVLKHLIQNRVLEIYIEAKMNFVGFASVDAYTMAQLVDAPRYKSEGRGFDSRLAYPFRQHYGRAVDSASNTN